MLNKFSNLDEIGELHMSGYDIDGEPIKGTKVYPCYTCGHCSNVIVLRADRDRDRKRCMCCGRLICEKSEICNSHCTPIHALASDHFENAGKYGLYVPAIMKGVTEVDEAHKQGLVTPLID